MIGHRSSRLGRLSYSSRTGVKLTTGSADGCALIHCSFIDILLLHDVTTSAHCSRIVLSITQAATLHTDREIVGCLGLYTMVHT